MANIRVWTSQGQWSKDVITGLDKIDLIKAIILKEYCPNYDEDYELPGLELDGKSISSEDFDAEAYDTNLDCFWGGFESKLRAEKKTDLSKIRTLKVRLSTIKDWLPTRIFPRHTMPSSPLPVCQLPHRLTIA